MNTDTRRFCVYTCIMGQYESLNEQIVANDRGVKFICFTNNANLRSDTWNIVHIEGLIEGDNSSSQRFIKILPEKFIPDYQYSLYIDNSVILNEIPFDIVSRFIESGLPIGLAHHSFRTTVLDEFLAVSLLQYDIQARLLEQFRHYAKSYKNELFSKVFWGGMILRNHKHPSLLKFEEKWFGHLLRFSNRDQISLAVLIEKDYIEYYIIDINNNRSNFHSWPVVSNRIISRMVGNVSREIEDQEELRKEISVFRSDNDPGLISAPSCQNGTTFKNIHSIDGANNFGAGGAVTFGIAEFPYAAPLASIKGELINKVDAELQGGIVLSTRPLGEAGQSLAPRIRIRSDGTLQIVPIGRPTSKPNIGDILLDENTKRLLICLDDETWSSVTVSNDE